MSRQRGHRRGAARNSRPAFCPRCGIDAGDARIVTPWCPSCAARTDRATTAEALHTIAGAVRTADQSPTRRHHETVTQQEDRIARATQAHLAEYLNPAVPKE